MFTGIVEEVGLVRAVQRRTGYQRTTVEATRVLEDVSVGDSISIDGACHTVVEAERHAFSFESVSETLERTTLGRLETGHRVNLERSVKLSDRLGGHLVAGHVDGMGRVMERRRWADNMTFRIVMPEELSAYLAAKGSIAVDGISLTVVAAGARDFTVTVIPHTAEATTIGERRVGDAVNLEVDLVARYLERLTGGCTDNGNPGTLRNVGIGSEREGVS
ncbi:MAG: riboflavin synthase [Gemmatimonadota bacterium]|nr:riboflavin synthase [Gemmatimonadota bacterium]